MDRDLLLQIIHFCEKPRPDHVKQLADMLQYLNRLLERRWARANAKDNYLVYARLGETKQCDVLEVCTIVLRHNLKRLRKVARRSDVVAT